MSDKLHSGTTQLNKHEAGAKLLNTPSKMDIFSKRPVLAIVLSLVLILVGIRAAMNISILQFPQISSASIQITTP